jgi:hypothetical protein
MSYSKKTKKHKKKKDFRNLLTQELIIAQNLTFSFFMLNTWQIIPLKTSIKMKK